MVIYIKKKGAILMKKFLSLFLAVVLIFGVMAPVAVFAGNGPYHVTIENANLESDEPYSALSLIDLESFEEYMIYPTLEDYPIPEDMKAQVVYDKDTNTLTLTNFVGQTHALIALCMGDDFKIALEGYNELLCIQSAANGWNSSITLAGTGELILNRAAIGIPAIDLYADGFPSTLTVEKDVKLTAIAGNEEDESSYSISVKGSTAETPVIMEAEMTAGEATLNEYTYEIIEEIRALDLDDAYYSYDIGLKKENDDALYIGCEYDTNEYLVSSLEYDEALNLYIAKAYTEDYELINPEEEGFTVIKDIPLYDEARNQYIGNPLDDQDETKKFVKIIDEESTLPLKKCVDENGIEFGYSESYDEAEGEEKTYTLYNISAHDKLEWVATKIERENNSNLDGYTPKVIKTEKRYDYLGAGTISTNGSKPISVPGIVKNVKLENGDGFIKITFSPVKDAEYYDVYSYDFKSKKWLLKQSFEAKENPSYQIEEVTADTTYFFIVIARNKAGSGSDSGKWSEITYRAPTRAVVYEMPSNGIKVKWYRHSEGVKYRLYRRAEGEKTWTKITDTTGSNYTDKTAKYGVNYQYAVRIFFSEGYSASKVAPVIRRVSKTALVSAINNRDGSIQFNWKKATGAEGYKIYRKTGKSGWTLLSVIEDPKVTSFTDKSAKKGTTYTYTARAYNSTANGAFESGITIKCLATPVIKVSNATKGVKITWNKVAGVSFYRVYRRRSGEVLWTALKDTKSLSFTDTKAAAGKTYEYTVRAIGGNSVSSWNVEGVLRLTNPALKTAKKAANGIKVTWGGVAGATSYNVYRKTAKSGWTMIGNTKAKSFVDKSAKKGVTYTYTVRACNAHYISSYSSTGIKGKY